MKTLAYFMIGNPGEDRTKALKTIAFAKELDPDYVHFSVLTPFPATPLYEMGLKQGRFKTDHWAEFARNPEVAFTPPLWEENDGPRGIDRLAALCLQVVLSPSRRWFGGIFRCIRPWNC
jgi:radical SAM superfamily enzyme YgiQ (UPF0313 family)